jgi:hypothetical protein
MIPWGTGKGTHHDGAGERHSPQCHQSRSWCLVNTACSAALQCYLRHTRRGPQRIQPPMLWFDPQLDAAEIAPLTFLPHLLILFLIPPEPKENSQIRTMLYIRSFPRNKLFSGLKSCHKLHRRSELASMVVTGGQQHWQVHCKSNKIAAHLIF